MVGFRHIESIFIYILPEAKSSLRGIRIQGVHVAYCSSRHYDVIKCFLESSERKYHGLTRMDHFHDKEEHFKAMQYHV